MPNRGSMKKGIIVLLITVLAAGMAFADFSGDAYVQFNADLDQKNYGLANGTDVSFTFKIDSESVKLAGENPVHVEVEAAANLIVDSTVGTGDVLIWSSTDKYGLGLVFSIKKALIVGENWSVSVLGAQTSAYDYAKTSSYYVKTKAVKDSFNNVKYYTWQPASYKASYTKAPGVTVNYDGYTASFGFKHTEADGTAFSATIQTKEFAFSDEMVKVQAAAEASQKAGAKANIGASAKAAFAVEDVAASIAADFGFEGIGDDAMKFAFDAAVAASYNFVSTTAYVFKGEKLSDDYKDLYLEATAEADLNAFEVPVTVSVGAENLIDKSEAGIGLSISAEYAQDAIVAGASFGMNLKDQSWNVNAYGKYDAEIFTAGANFAIDSTKAIGLGAYVETSAIVEGATFGLNYGLSNDYAMYYGGHYCTSNAINTNDLGAEKLGTVGAYCIIGF